MEAFLLVAWLSHFDALVVCRGGLITKSSGQSYSEREKENIQLVFISINQEIENWNDTLRLFLLHSFRAIIQVVLSCVCDEGNSQ